MSYACVAKMAAALGLGPSVFGRAGSTPVTGTWRLSPPLNI